MVGDKPAPSSTSALDGAGRNAEQVSKRLSDAKDFAVLYLSAQAGRLRVVIRNSVLFALIGVLAVIVLATFAIVAVVLLCDGAAGGIGALLGGRTWAGDLVVGVVVLGCALTVGWTAISQIRKISRRNTVKSYLKNKVPR